MNEENPILEFLIGAAAGFFIAIAVFLPLIPVNLLLFNEAVNSGEYQIYSPASSGDQTWLEQAVPAKIKMVMGAYALFMSVFLIVMAILAFREKRPYYGMGLLATILIPLLFSGACTAVFF